LPRPTVSGKLIARVIFATVAMSSSLAVQVPATTANLGPGFDCLGAALTLHNTFHFSKLDGGNLETGDLEIQVIGVERDRVSTDTRNLVYQSFLQLFAHLGQTPPPVRIVIEMGVPLARGLGSSATAIVGGLLGANWFAGSPLDTAAIMQLAIALEGHPDNVVPALIGGCRLAATDSRSDWQICDIPWHANLVPVVAIPDFELSTQAARSVLPAAYSRADAIFNTAHLGLLLRGLATGHADWLQAALQDRIHQPYRQALIPGYAAVQAAAIAAGAHGVVISGAGPTLLALTDAPQAAVVGRAMQAAWSHQAITATVHTLALDATGATQTLAS
jgi:homoserine kinase